MKIVKFKNMKQILLIFIVAISIFSTSCKKEEDKSYYSSIGVIKITADSIILETDYNQRLLIVNTINSTIINNDRVVIGFYMADGEKPRGIDYLVEVSEIQKVLTKPITVLTPELLDSVSNDELTIDGLWVSKNYLNLNFIYYGGYQKHYIHLTRAPGDIPTDTVELEIRHNSNGDNGSSGYYAFVSFDLTTLKNTVADSVILHVKAKEYNSRNYDKYLTYKY
jgi:hypothetical protein